MSTPRHFFPLSGQRSPAREQRWPHGDYVSQSLSCGYPSTVFCRSTGRHFFVAEAREIIIFPVRRWAAAAK